MGKPKKVFPYPATKIEKRWQLKWEEDLINKVPDDDVRPKWYQLTMYPYPSGDLHIGHWYNYAPADTQARFRRMQGYNVLQPIGFDAFGLPAENAAIKRNIHPYKWTMENISNMRKQFKSLGPMYDWDREIICAVPEYYRWNQWLFLKLYENGLAYRNKAPVVWCPSCQTVLANEQVLNGLCERCETPVTRRDLQQWFLRITNYNEQLLDFSGLIDWPKQIITMQRNWIGRSEGVDIRFDISHLGLETKSLHTFTTRIDTIYGVTFIALAPEHPMIKNLTSSQQIPLVTSYIEQARKQTEIERLSTSREKTGVPLGTYAINYVNGNKIPLFVADYVLTTYGTGIVMGVPAHDQRDFLFASKYGIPIKHVIRPENDVPVDFSEAYSSEGILINSELFDNLPSGQAMHDIANYIENKSWGHRTISYRIRDWLISRQRYWGTPIPIVYCDKCGTVPVPLKELPVLLPPTAEFKPTGESPLATNYDFMNTKCPSCSNPAKRETDTMDTFVDSAWYMFRFASPQYDNGPFDPSLMDKWLPVDQYTGGAEHAVMHLLYARFFTKALKSLGLVKFNEPFLRLFNQGTIIAGGTKMSKSKGNVINPDDYVETVGADIVRMYLMFLGPWEQGGDWTDTGINGINRWVNRIWELMQRDSNALSSNVESSDSKRKLHQTIEKVYNHLDRFKFNTAIASLMELSNHMSTTWDDRKVSQEIWDDSVTKFLLMLAPFAPHLAEELWERAGHKYSIHNHKFPEWDSALSAEESVTVVVQINGKLRERIEVPVSIDESDVKEMALSSPKIKPYIDGKQMKNLIYVPNRLINIVID